MEENGGYAFPVPDFEVGGNRKTANIKGMTLRDYFAAAALQGMLARPPQGNSIPRSRDIQANAAYAWADALIQARDRVQTESGAAD